jgi:peptidoglycan/xylan/chitin deacetylase (PgdA/CDA1 family)
LNGTFIISLDFELHWGGVEKWPIENYQEYFLNTRAVIPEMLNLFKKYEIHATWATVGMLMNNSKTELLANAPEEKPTYLTTKLSAYNYIDTKGIGENETRDPFHFAASLVQKIIDTPNQELASHTYSHFYCNEKGQTVDQFRADLQSAQYASRKFGKTLASLVFPRNQFNDQYLKVCFEEGITAVRSNPVDWFWRIESTQDESRWKRLNRGMDAYFQIGKKNTYTIGSVITRNDFPVCLPASRLLRPYNPNEYFLNGLKLRRIREEIEKAAKSGEIYHLWWHPHNFGNHPTQSLEGLEDILRHFWICREKWRIRSLNMNEVSNHINGQMR